MNCHASTRGAYACTAESISDIKSVGIHDSMINAEIAVKVCAFVLFVPCCLIVY